MHDTCMRYLHNLLYHYLQYYITRMEFGSICVVPIIALLLFGRGDRVTGKLFTINYRSTSMFSSSIVH